jgi:hypothetical protein
VPILAIIKGVFASAKFWAAIGAAGLLTGFAIWGYNQVWTSGYRAAEVEYQAEKLKAVERAVKEARAQWERSSQAAMQQIEREREITERARELERDIRPTVEGSVPDACRDLGPDIQRLFNEAIRPGGDREGSPPSDPPGADGRMP